MVVISKELFYEKIGPDVSCRIIMHPWSKNCLKSKLDLFLYFIPGVLYFYLPIYLVKILYNYKKISKSFFKETFKSYLKSIAYGNAMTALFASSHCMLYNVFKRSYYSTIVALPGFIAGLSLLFESADNQYINTIIWSTMVIETIIRRLDFFKIIKLTKWTETLGFAGTSSLLMYLFARNRSKNNIIPPNLWFYQPKPISNNLRPEGVCSHNSKNTITPCTDYIFNEFQKYFGAGLAISVVKNILNFKFNINFENIKFGLLLGGYVGVYRAVVCSLFSVVKCTNVFQAILAGFAAGTVYAIKPNKSLFAIAIATAIQIYCAKYSQGLSKKKKLILQQLLYMTCNGILFHNLIMARDTTPNYFIKMTSTATRGYVTNVYNELIKTYLFNK